MGAHTAARHAPAKEVDMATRRTAATIAGSRESMAIAATLGGQVRHARRRRRLTLRALAARVGISVTRLSEIERGLGARAPLETWVAIGVALERPLAVALTASLGEPTHGPADAHHLAIQEHVLSLARRTGRPGTFEVPTRPLDPSRSTDVGIRDTRHDARILAECWNSFGDLGAAMRATTRKAAEAVATWPHDRVATVWIVRASASNRSILARYPQVVEAAFPGSSRRWVRALERGDVPPPHQPGVVWFDPATGRLTEHRRARMTP
jgi:transcriptional regulator with XRE-family HTH domain